MFIRLITYIFGIYLISLSISFMIIYLNLFALGYNFIYYVNFIIRKPVIIFGLVGVLLVLFSFRKGHTL